MGEKISHRQRSGSAKEDRDRRLPKRGMDQTFVGRKGGFHTPNEEKRARQKDRNYEREADSDDQF